MDITSSQRPQIALSFTGFLLIGMLSGGWGVMLPGVSAYYAVDKAVVGLLFFASATGYFLSALGSGFLVQKMGQRRYLILGTTAFLVGNTMMVLKPPFIAILVTRLFTGMGVAVMEAGLNMYITRLPNNASLLNYMHAFFGIGALVGPIVASSLLALNWDWSYVFLIWSILTFPFLLGLIALLKGQPTEARPQEGGNQASEHAFLTTLKLPIVWLATLFLLFYVGVESSVGNWSYSFLLEQRHEGELFAGWIVSGYWMGLTLGRFMLNNIAQRLRMSIAGMMYCCLAGIGLGMLLLWLLPGMAVDVIGLGLIGFCLGPIYPTTVALVPRIVPDHIIADAIGFLIGVSTIGIALFPWLAGTLAQYTGIGSLLPYTVALVAVMLCFWIGIARKSWQQADL